VLANYGGVGMYKKSKKVTSVVIVVIMLYLNVSVDFSVLFNTGTENGHFIQLGAEKAWAADTYYMYDKYIADYIWSGEQVTYYTSTNPYSIYYFDESGNNGTGKKYYYYGYANVCWNEVSHEYDYSGTEVYTYGSKLSSSYNYIKYSSDEKQSYFKPTALISTSCSSGVYKAKYSGTYVSRTRGDIGAATLTQSGIIALSGTYPDNGQHTDGYWYIKVTTVPSFSITTPMQNSTFCESDTAYTPQISAYDADNDSLTCKYYIDLETTACDTKTCLRWKTG
jgi:hypothetical protein